MKKLLFACVGVGLALGGGYLLYKKWTHYDQDKEEDAKETEASTNTQLPPIKKGRDILLVGLTN